jgi:hypothetical protein
LETTSCWREWHNTNDIASQFLELAHIDQASGGAPGDGGAFERINISVCISNVLNQMLGNNMLTQFEDHSTSFRVDPLRVRFNQIVEVVFRRGPSHVRSPQFGRGRRP